MNVQMPEMDGLQASRRITAKYPPHERLHIVAMTVNAMQGDREACLAAGMGRPRDQAHPCERIDGGAAGGESMGMGRGLIR